MTQRYEAALRDTGLRPTQLTLLHTLDRMGESPQSALGAQLVLDPTTLSRTLRPLARAGWIRAAPGKDRRETRWRLTARGRRRLAAARPAWERAQQDMRTRLVGKDWKTFLEELAEVATAAV